MSVKLVFTITERGDLTQIDSQSHYDVTSTDKEKLHADFIADLLRQEFCKCEARFKESK
jgi:hypothetical protein